MSLVLAGPVLLGSTLYSHVFWKVCEAQGREMLPQHRRHGRKLYFANLTWAFVSCPPSPSAILPSRRTHGLWPHTQGGRGKLGPAPLHQVSVGWCMRPGPSILRSPRRATGLWPFPNCEWVVLSLTVSALQFLPHWFPRKAHLGVRGPARGAPLNAHGLGVWGSNRFLQG